MPMTCARRWTSSHGWIGANPNPLNEQILTQAREGAGLPSIESHERREINERTTDTSSHAFGHVAKSMGA